MRMCEQKPVLHRKDECLRCGQILRIAEYVARQYDIPFVDRVLFRREYNEAVPQPLHCEAGGRKMWVDKYYLAYMLEDGVVRYVYNTRYHIREEHRNWRDASKKRGNAPPVPKDVLRSFHKSGYEMFVAGHTCWVEKNFLEKIFGKPQECTKVNISM